MTANERIGEGKFPTPLDLLPGERVLWSGGPPWRAGLFYIGRWGLMFLVPMLFLVAIFALPDSPAKDEAPATPTHATSGNCRASSTPPCPDRTTAAPTPVAQPPSAEALEAERRHAQVEHRFALAFGGLAGVFLFWVLSEAILRVRRAWYIITSERICLHSGGWTRTLTVIDLDKVISVQAQSSSFETLMGLQNIELTHAGSSRDLRNPYRYLMTDPYTLAHVPAKGSLLSDLVNQWLPRDNRQGHA